MELKTQEALKIVWEVLNQGDSRYNNAQEEMLLADFLSNKAILLEIKDNLIFEGEKVSGIQGKEKGFASQLLKEEGFKEEEIFFERMFKGSRVDVLAKSKDKMILVECCSCRINKIRTYLLNPNTEVWVIIRDELSKIYKFKRGTNWNLVKAFEKKKMEQLKTIKSPLDE